MKQNRIVITALALLLMNFQCERHSHKPLTIANLTLANTCTDEQTAFTMTLYLRSHRGFLPVDEKTVAVNNEVTFQFTTYDPSFIKLESLGQTSCRSSWHQLDQGQRQSIDMTYSREQPVRLQLTSTPTDTATSLSIEIYRTFGNTTLYDDDDQIVLTDLSADDFPITDITLSTTSSYRIILYEHIGQSKNILSNTTLETSDDGDLVAVSL